MPEPPAPDAAAASSSPRAAPTLRGRLRALRGRPDTEHEMSFNRLAFALVITLFLVLEEAPRHTIEVVAAYWLVAFALFAHILARPATNNPRRITALVLDIAFLSYEMWAGGELTSVLAPIYLWVVLGNGFRFGVRWLRGAQLVALAFASVMVVATPFWHDQVHLAAGFLLGLIAIPAYAGTLIGKLSAAKAQAEAANAAKTMFLAGVSHELRTPLNAIIGMGTLLERSGLPPEQNDMARTVSDSGRHLLGLINGILDFSRIEAGQMQVRSEPLELPTLLGEVARMLSGPAAEKGLRLRLHATPRVPEAVLGDRHLLREVLLNLASNAIKFTSEGGVTIAVDATGDGDGGARRLRFEVSDTGIGIAHDAQARIFEAFVQADATIINRFGGTGLGLAVCKRTVELLGGAIGVESAPGRGSTFWCEIPLVLPERGAPAPPPLAGDVVLLAAEAAALASGWQAAEPALARLVFHPAATLAEAVTALGRLPRGGAPRVLLADAQSVGLAAEALAQTLHMLDPGGEWRPILLDGQAGEGLPPSALRDGFSSLLPRRPAPASVAAALRLAGLGAAAAAPAAPSRPAAPRRPLSVLVADDNRTNLRVAGKVLESGGHVPTLLDSAEAALDLLEEQEFDLVLMDLNMPDLDGLEAAKLYQLQSLGRRQVPWAALTADATEEAARRCREAGFVERLVKPIAPDDLLAAVQRLAPAEAPVEVASIASHPRFRSKAQLSVDPQALKRLEELGGEDFVRDVLDDFQQDAEEILAELRRAARLGDPQLFRSKAHALHSVSANVGALALCELCAAAQESSATQLREQAPSMAERFAVELARTRSQLLAALQGRAADGPDASRQ